MNKPPNSPRLDKAGKEIMEVPVFVAATSPFTIVMFDEGDEPDFSLEQVNGGTYDHVKLCRTTTGLNPSLEAMDNMAVIVSYTGALLFPRIGGLSKDDILASANRLLLKLTFGGITFDAMTPGDIGFGYIYGSGYFITGGGASGASFNALHSLQHRDVGSSDSMKLLFPRKLKASQLHEAFNAGGEVVDSVPQLNPSLFLNGLTYFRQREFAPSLVFLWSSCESLIGRLWSDHVVQKGSGIPGRRRFIEGNGWQAAQMVEVLFQLGIVNDDLYTDLNRARTSRNALAHKGDIPGVEDCKAALKSSFKLVSAIRSNGKNQSEFGPLIERLASVHDPRTGPLEPKYWREIPAVPGDGKWEGDYPRYPEIELVPIKVPKHKKR